MSDENVVTAQLVEGSPEGTGSQATEPAPQGSDQPQNTSQPQVEGTEQSTSRQAPARPKVSDFYESRREVKELRSEIQQMNEQIRKMGLQQPAPTPKTADAAPTDEQLLQEYFKNPIAFRKRELEQFWEELKKELREKEFPQLIEKRESERTYERNVQEALELLFPKNSSQPNEELADRIARDPGRAEKVKAVIKENKLDLIDDPKIQANIALKILSQEAKPVVKVNPAVPKKSQMGSTVTGTPANGVGGMKNMTLQEIRAQQKAQADALENNPSLRYDEKFIATQTQIHDALVKRASELTAGQ